MNASVAGVSKVGLTYALTRNFELRPAISFGWSRTAPAAGGNSVTTTDYGASLDALFGSASHDALRPYYGIGGSYTYAHLNGSSGHTLGALALFGLRVRALPRVHLYAEAAVADRAR